MSAGVPQNPSLVIDDHLLQRKSIAALFRSSQYLLFPLVLVILIAAFSGHRAMAQTGMPGGQRIIHESWTFKDGAPEQPRAFAQTADGYLWVGAPAGLFRFDGVRFELFRSPFGDQLQSTNVSALFAPARGGLWVGYWFGGFSFLKNGKITNFVEGTGTVFGFAQDRDGVLWCAANRGLWRFDGSSWQRIGAEWGLVPNQSMLQVGLDREGILWAIAGRIFDVGHKQLYFLPQGERKFRKAGDNLFVKGFTWDADVTVLTTHERRPPEPGSSVELENSLPAYPILRKRSEQIVDRANGIWFFSSDGPILRHPAGEPLADIVDNASLSNSDPYDLDMQEFARLVDREGSLWIGTGTGVDRFSYSPLIQQELPKPPGPLFVVAPDEGGIVWISAGNGMGSSVLYRVANGKVDFQKLLAGASTFAYRAPDKTIWFGGEGGLWHMVNGSLTRVDLPQEALRGGKAGTSTQDREGGEWVSFGSAGLYRLKDGVWTKYEGRQSIPNPQPQSASSPAPAPGCPVLIAYTDTLKRIWFGCVKNQLAVLDADRLESYGPNNGVQVGNVTAFYGRGSEVWIGGEFGLQRFDHGRFRTITAVDKESLRGISGIVETANGDLWLNGLEGIVHLRRAEIVEALKNPDYQVSGERFDRRAGLPGLPSQFGSLPTAIEGTDGRLWFNVNNGVVWLDPTRASNKIPPPQVAIQSVSADDKGYGLDQPLSFSAHTSNVQIGYSAVSLLNPEAIRFRYKLRETDKDWHEVGTSTPVSYRNLPPGSYHFVVAASDTNGVWSDNTATAEFSVLPAFYQTNWFRALCAAAFLALLWAAYQWRVRQLHHQFEMTLVARVGERTRIARELHDTLLQSFHGLLLRFQTVSQLLPGKPVDAKEKLDSAIDQAAVAITEGRDAVQGLRDSTLQGNDLALAISTLGEELAGELQNEKPAFGVAVEGKSRALHPILRDEIYKIAAEALRNAFHHAEGQRVEVELRYDTEQFRLRIRDDGKGIDSAILLQKAKEGHFGLHGMQERAKLVGAKLAIWSEVDAGTEVQLSLPAKLAYAKERKGSWLSRKFAAKA